VEKYGREVLWSYNNIYIYPMSEEREEGAKCCLKRHFALLASLKVLAKICLG
jgi:hypothetical protein